MVFANNSILPCFFFFLIIAELVIPTGTATNEANVEIETQPLTAEIKTRNV